MPLMTAMSEMFIPAPRAAIRRWLNNEIGGTALMRLLVSDGQWMVPISGSVVGEMLQQGVPSRVMFSRDRQGVSRLFIFSDSDAYGEFSKAPGNAGQQHFLTTKGTWVFRMPLDGIDFIAIDAASPHQIAYGRDLFSRLKQMADAVEVEEALLELRAGPDPPEDLLKLVRDYQGYTAAVQKADKAIRIAMAPDAEGRSLAAVFTHDEAFEAYLKATSESYREGELDQMSFAGSLLFEQILKMRVDGIVFNCCGPPKPVAFALQFARLVLNLN
jgi:hypothetical protein